MPGTAALIGFVAATLVVLLIPGRAVLYVVARSVNQGQRAGVVSVLGLSAGARVHVVAATVGLSAILLASATAFGVVKALGAAYYLIYLGLRALMGPRPTAGLRSPGPRASRRLFADGVVVNVLNVGLALCTDSAHALLAGRLRYWFAGRVMHGPLPRYASGAVYIGLGVSTAFADRR